MISSQKGGILIEAAWVLPLILILVFILIEIGFILLQYIAIKEGISLASRDLSLPQKNSQGELICNEIVSSRLKEQMRKFRQMEFDDQFDIVVKRASDSELLMYVDTKVYCSLCRIIYSETPFVLSFEEPVILQDSEPPCEVDR